jgi:hypothetical protein
MTNCRETSNVKGKTSRGKAVAHEASFVKRISLRKVDVSRFTFHEKRTQSQAGR